MSLLLVSFLLIGDSITAGTVSEPIGPSYAELVGGVNRGVSGQSTRDWLPGLSLFDALPAAYTVTLLLGTNDASGFLEPGPVPVEEYEANLRSIIAALYEHGTLRVIVMTPPRNFAAWDNAAPDRLRGYRQAVLWLCSEGVAECGPDVHELLGPEHFAVGDVHPNGAGHALIAEALPEPDSGLLFAVALLTLGAVYWVKRSGE